MKRHWISDPPTPAERANDGQQHNATYDGYQEAGDVEPEGEGATGDQLHDEPTDEGTDDADDDRETAASAAAHDQARDPTSKRTEDNP